MGPIWGRQDPGGTHVGSMNFAIWTQEYTREDQEEIRSLNWAGLDTGPAQP